MKPLPRGLIAVACSLLVLARAQAIAPWPMAGGNYFEGFGTIATWTNDFASPAEATRWGSVAVNGSGTIPDGRRTTVATSVFTTTTTGGVQRGAGNLIQLSTGPTDNTSANAVDLYLDFTGQAPDTLAFDWVAVANGTGNRASSLRVYTTTNGVNFVELTNASVLNRSNNVVASGSITNIPLPAWFNNCATSRIRFYEYNGTGGSSSNRAKIAIDNVSVTRAVLPVATTLPATGASSAATLNGTVNPSGSATAAWFEWGFSPFGNTNFTAPVAVGGGMVAVAMTNLLSSLTPGLVYHARLIASNVAGMARGGDIPFGSPALTLFGPATMTNEMLSEFVDPGAVATGAPLAIAGGGEHSLVLKMDGTVAAWGYNGLGQTTIPAGLSNVVAVSAGEYHSLALRRDGTVAMWSQATVPADLSNVVGIASGSTHILVLKSDGTVVAWGDNSTGQATVPVGLSSVVAIAGGGYHSLALKSDGTIVGWGHNFFGQRTAPPGLSNVVAIGGGVYHSLALNRDGIVTAWGAGLINNGSTPYYGQSIVPAGLSNVVSIAAGYYHSLALKNDGTVVAWGYNVYGQTNIPVGLSNVVAIAAGGHHNLALMSDGTIVSWGDNGSGQSTIPEGLSSLTVTVGGTFNTNNGPGVYTRTYSANNSIGGTTTATRTVVVVVLPIATTLPATGASNTVATLNGTVIPHGNATTAWFEWGLSPFGYTNFTAPVAVGSGEASVSVTSLLSNLTPGLIHHGRLVASNVVAVVHGLDVAFGSPLLTLNGAATMTNECHAAFADPGASATGAPLAMAGGGSHSLVLKMDGTVAGWGYNGFGQTTIPAGLSNVVAVSAGEYHSLALRRDGTVAMWSQATVPAGLSNVVAIASGSTHILALQSDGTVVAWGANGNGQSTPPVGLSNVVAVAGGGFHSLALKGDGAVAAWGHNFFGQTTIPPGLSDVVAIAGGLYHSLALKSNGTVAAWGAGLLNDGSVSANYGQSIIPAGLSNVVSIAAGYYHSLALKSDGTVAAWGDNRDGQTNIPVGLSNVVAIAAGAHHNLALKSDGTVVAWGDNFDGQTTIPGGLSSLTVIVGGTFSTNNAPGVYTHTYTSRNSLGDLVTATRTVVVKDTLPPVITLQGSNPLVTPPDVTFIDPGVTALDGCDGSPTVTTNTTVNLAVPGVYSSSYIATDSSGNSATNTRTVIVGVLPVATALPVTDASNTVATLNGTINPGSLPVTAWFEWGLYGVNNTNLTAPVTVGSGTNDVAVSNLLSGLTPGLTYRGRLVASNALAFVRGLDVLFGTPLLTLNGSATVTNECHTGFADPIATATSAPRAIAAGAAHGLVLKGNGTVAAWGRNEAGQATIPVGLSNAVAIAGGYSHSLALKSDGTIAAWGYNNYGQTTIPSGLSNVVAIAGGGYHSLALKSNGTVAVWGYNGDGELTIPMGLSNVAAIATGGYHSLALKSDGTVAAWGRNLAGQATIPVGLSNVIALAGGDSHSLALKSDGTVAAWGGNQYGETTIPVGLSNVVAIAGGNFHNLALKRDGTVAAWGLNNAGQTTIPVSLSNVVAIAAGGSYSLALKGDGTVAAWGYNGFGQTTIPVGLSALAVFVGGTFSTNNAPGVYTRTYNASNSLGGVAIATRTIVVQDTLPPVITLLGSNLLTNRVDVPFVDPGATTLDICGGILAVTTNSTVNGAVLGTYSVSYTATDSSGNSATNTRTVVISPVPPIVTTLPATGISNTVATLNGTINPGTLPATVWFEWRLDGGNSTNLTAPVTMGGGADAVTVSNLLSNLTPGLIYRGCLVASNAQVIVRGLEVSFGSPLLTLNGAATITNECHADFADPGAATGIPLAVAGGLYHSLALKGDGTVAAWGAGLLNDGSLAVNYGQSIIPAGLSNVVSIAAGHYHSLALKRDGTVAAWGQNYYGQTSVPVGLSNVVAVAGGVYHTLALKSDGTVAAWGYNGYGQTTIPVGLSNVVAIAGGVYHNLALKSDGAIAAWGYNGYGQGNIPAGLSNVVAIAAGNAHGLALKSDGTVAAWGFNGFGQTTVPEGLSNVVAIAAGYQHSLALKRDGTVAAWGGNQFGATTLPAGLSNVVSIAGGAYHSLALKDDGTVAAWGYNGYGQTTIPMGLSTFAVNLTVDGTFNTDNSPGTYTRIYGASNSLGGIATPLTRTIVVQDTLPPVITLMGSNPLTILTNTPFMDPGATALDACGGSSAVTTNNPVNVAVPGIYTVSYIATDSYGHSATNTRMVVVVAPPRVISSIRLGNGTFQFGFTNQPGVGFTVWASTNVTLPFAQWSNLGAPVESPAGTFLFTDPQATIKAQRFYRVSSP